MRSIKSCRTCVIGGAGFLGSHLVRYLVEERGCYVLVLDNLLTGLMKHVPTEKHIVDFIEHDIRWEEKLLTKILDRYRIDYVFNYAAEPYIPECFERPLHFFDINATAVLRVLNAVQKSPSVKALLQVSSAEIYGDCKGQIKEDDPVEPRSTYGVSKMAADNLVRVRWREAQVPAIALRQFNCIGERETHEYVVPEIISQWHEVSDNFIKLGNNSKRDFLYAGDAVRMAVELLEKGEFGEVYNMGSEEVIRIYDLAMRIGRLMEVPPSQLDIHEDASRRRPWEIWHLQSDNTKLYSTIESRPEVSLDEALKRTIRYFRDNGNKWDWRETKASSSTA